MYIGILKFQVEVDETAENTWSKAAMSLCEKLRARFKVVARVGEHDDGYCIAVTMLAGKEAALNQLFEKILEFAESVGIGRVQEELAFVEHLDAFES